MTNPYLEIRFHTAIQTSGGDVAFDVDSIVYLRPTSSSSTGVVFGASSTGEFFISVDNSLQDLLDVIGAGSFLAGRQTGGSRIAVNLKRVRFMRAEGDKTIFIFGQKGDEEFAVSIDLTLAEVLQKARPAQSQPAYAATALQDISAPADDSQTPASSENPWTSPNV